MELINRIRQLHGAIYEYKLDLNREAEIKKIIKTGISKSNRLISGASKEKYDVDIVVTWVDGSDPIWLDEKKRYQGSGQNNNNSDARFRDWDLFKYWFRAVECYAPWVRNIYLITYGHLPLWLNTDNPKLKIVKHKEIINSEYLPTYSSHTIEFSIHNIEGLSEHFVYFNDDMYLNRPSEISDFFYNGFPRYCCIANPIFPSSNMKGHAHARVNTIGLINDDFDVSAAIKSNPEKWFSTVYGKMTSYNEYALRNGKLPGMYFSHVGVPYRKSTIDHVSEVYKDRIHETSMHRFRTSDDIMHQVFSLWEMIHGSFDPVSPFHYGDAIKISEDSIDDLCKRLDEGKQLMLCINDNENLTKQEFFDLKSILISHMENKFPCKSKFEL